VSVSLSKITRELTLYKKLPDAAMNAGRLPLRSNVSLLLNVIKKITGELTLFFFTGAPTSAGGLLLQKGTHRAVW